MNIYRPTYLYIKQHSITGLFYFGKTVKNPEKYNGSGIYWTNHIKKHGKEFIITLWYCLFLDEESIIETAKLISQLNNIVESDKWANLIPENGINGGGDCSQMRQQLVLDAAISKYGRRGFVENMLSHSAREKAKISHEKKYGKYGACLTNQQSIETRNETNLKLYGNKCAANNDVSHEKSKETQSKLRQRQNVHILRQLAKQTKTKLGIHFSLKSDDWIDQKIIELSQNT